MFSRKIKMKCGHFADTIMTDVPMNKFPSFGDEFADVAACSFCFREGQTVNQPACAMAERQEHTVEYKPEIARNVTIPVLGALAVIITIIALIASI